MSTEGPQREQELTRAVESVLGVRLPGRTRTKALELFRSGAVEVQDVQDAHVVCAVQGGEDYRVDLTFRPSATGGRGRWLAACNCPAFTKFGPCKHLYAAALEATSEGLLSGVAQDQRESRRAERGAAWRAKLEGLTPGSQAPRDPFAFARGRDAQVRYRLDLEDARKSGRLSLAFDLRRLRKNGEWGPWQRLELNGHADLAELPADARDAVRLVTGLVPGEPASDYAHDRPGLYRLEPARAELCLPRLAATGQLFAELGDELHGPLEFDDGAPWNAAATWRDDPPALTLQLERAGETLDADQVLWIGPRAYGVARSRVFRVASHAPWRSLDRLVRDGALAADESDPEALREAALQAGLLTVASEGELQRPIPALTAKRREDERFDLRLTFEYPGASFDATAPPEAGWRDADGLPQRRHGEAEREALERLLSLGVEPAPPFELNERHAVVHARRLGAVLSALVAEGWTADLDGVRQRSAPELFLKLKRGGGGFDLSGALDYGGELVDLSAALDALARGATSLPLGDGSAGLLSDVALRLQTLEALTEKRGAGRAQQRELPEERVPLAALLLAASGARVDTEPEIEARLERLRGFRGAEPTDAPAGLQAQLRSYQREGLGWLASLDEFGLGGCLADDMGLGKTLQTLALILRTRGEGPTLVVAPRTLMFHWLEEAARFAPELNAVAYHGEDREQQLESLPEADLVLTTYGVLRRDALPLSAVAFRRVVLDEAQAIKNPTSQTARAAKALRAERRLALTGTPIENHAGDLLSLVEFLEPELLAGGAMARLAELFSKDPRGIATHELRRAFGPLFLRRTKTQVLTELPPRSEQVLRVELGGEHRATYLALLAHQRALMEGAEAGKGAALLEALLRLRQAACHPGLVDPSQASVTSAKLEVLVEQLAPLVSQGQKALVFSSFTGLLDLTAKRLEREGWRCLQLDGRTRDRAGAVRQFQAGEADVFLLSLKAGGTGLNLTAASYVFLLDPWWNPAAERQAIDRAHRLGQQQPVSAYRLVASDTIEDQVLALAASKRELFDGLFGDDAPALGKLAYEELVQLFRAPDSEGV